MTAPRPAPPGVHPGLAAAFAVLEDAGLRWALIRGADELAHPEGDVDVLVEPVAAQRLAGLLAAAGYRRLGSRGHGSHLFFHAREGGDWLKLDLVTEVAFGAHQELGTDLAAGCLARRRSEGGIWRLDERDEAWLVLLHLLLDKGGIPPARRALAARSADLADADAAPARAVDELLGAGTAVQVRAVCAAAAPGTGPETASAQLAARLADRWAQRDRLRTSGTRFRSRVLRRLALPVPGHPAGLLVAVVGPDGAGKSTVVAALAEQLPLGTQTVYSGLWQPGRADRLLRVLPGGRLSRSISRLLRSSAAARWGRLRGRVVLGDRFAHDALLAGSVDRSLGGRIVTALAGRVAAEPDLVLLLDAPGEVMFARKGEHTPALLEERRQDYLRLAERFADAVVLDAAAPLAEVVERAAAEVWARLRR